MLKRNPINHQKAGWVFQPQNHGISLTLDGFCNPINTGMNKPTTNWCRNYNHIPIYFLEITHIIDGLFILIYPYQGG